MEGDQSYSDLLGRDAPAAALVTVVMMKAKPTPIPRAPTKAGSADPPAAKVEWNKVGGVGADPVTTLARRRRQRVLTAGRCALGENEYVSRGIRCNARRAPGRHIRHRMTSMTPELEVVQRPVARAFVHLLVGL